MTIRWPCWARTRPAGSPWWWMAGTPGHCAVWYCRTPWGALQAARRLHGKGLRQGGMTDGVPAGDDAVMRRLFRHVDDAVFPGDPPFDVEKGLERLREGMRKTDEDPAERKRIERLAAGARELYGEDLGGEE